MWTISNKQLQKITTSLTKAANKVSEKAINKSMDAIENLGKEKVQESQSPNENSQGSTDTNKSNKTANPSKKENQNDSKTNQQAEQSDPKKSSSKENAQTTQTTEPVLPCEQVEVISLMSYKPTELPQKEILETKWLTNDDNVINGSLILQKVKINVKTNGFFDGEKLKMNIVDSKNKVLKKMGIVLCENESTTELFMVEKDWLDEILFISFEL